VDITPLTAIHDEEKTVDVAYDIAQGEKVYFERINITATTAPVTRSSAASCG